MGFFISRNMENQDYPYSLNEKEFAETGYLVPPHFKNSFLTMAYRLLLSKNKNHLYADDCMSPLREFQLKILEAKIAETRAILASPKRQQELIDRIWERKKKREAKTLAQKAEQASKPAVTPMTSCVYIAFDDFTGHYKIGYSTNLKTREKLLKVTNSGLEIIEYFKGSKDDEAAMHERFKGKRVRGEWFDLTEKDLETIRTYFFSLPAF